ncbi:MAG: SDR family oxidoreductase [Pseudomonadota bacterium]
MAGEAALVTGAGKRLGRAMALGLAARGLPVIVHYNSSADAANDVVREITSGGGKAASVGANLMDENAVAGLIDAARDAIGAPLALLVNSASTFENDDIDTMTRASWDLHLEVNLRAPVALAQAFARQRPSVPPSEANANASDNGLIVNLIDQRVKKLTPQFLTYTASKAALMSMTITLAQALGPRGIRVNAIGPGPTLRNKRQSAEDWRIQNDATVLGHGATPDDIVHALNYLIDAKAVTGQMIAVDGGQHLSWQTPDVMITE